MELDFDIDDCWPSGRWEELVCQAITVLTGLVPALANPRLCTSLLLTGDAEVHALNREWRGKDKPTNVLSFPMMSGGELAVLSPDGPPVLLGDIALAFETCAGEADEKGVALEHHAVHLIVHGLLHLAGHDHEISSANAEAMEYLEIKALAQIGIGNPYDDLQSE